MWVLFVVIASDINVLFRKKMMKGRFRSRGKALELHRFLSDFHLCNIYDILVCSGNACNCRWGWADYLVAGLTWSDWFRKGCRGRRNVKRTTKAKLFEDTFFTCLSFYWNWHSSLDSKWEMKCNFIFPRVRIKKKRQTMLPRSDERSAGVKAQPKKRFHFWETHSSTVV